jgi:hypothetical protein
MKVKVIKKFIDKHTGKLHKEGEILNIKKDRLDEIKAVDINLVEEIAEPKATKKATKKDTE